MSVFATAKETWSRAYTKLEHKEADLGILIGDHKARRTGLGKAAWGAIMKHLFENEGFKKITGGAQEPNQAMIKIFLSWGMQLETTIAATSSDDVILRYGIKHQNWDEIQRSNVGPLSSFPS